MFSLCLGSLGFYYIDAAKAMGMKEWMEGKRDVQMDRRTEKWTDGWKNRH